MGEAYHEELPQHVQNHLYQKWRSSAGKWMSRADRYWALVVGMERLCIF